MALRISVEQLEALSRYKLRMFAGVLINGPADVYFDNKSVVDSLSLPQRTLQKKQHDDLLPQSERISGDWNHLG